MRWKSSEWNSAWVLGFAVLAAMIIGPNKSAGGVVRADFNDLVLGPLGAGGQMGGIGFADGSAWGNTGTINVIVGDLTAPAGTTYAITQNDMGSTRQ